MLKKAPFPQAVLFLLVSVSAVTGAEAHALELKVPIAASVAASDRLLSSARESEKAYLIDLSTGNEGVAFRIDPKLQLPPGRYRLHALVGAAPSQKDVVDPIELVLYAGDRNRHLLPDEIPKSGPLADAFLDFVVTDDKPVALSLNWFVGMSLLKVAPQEKAKAHQGLLKRRAAELTGVAHAPDPLAATPPAGTSELDDSAHAANAAPQLVSISKTPLPKYRLIVAGVHIEAMCPIAIEQVQTDKSAYEPGEEARVEVALRNFSKSEIRGTLSAQAVAGDKAAGGPAPAGIAVTLPPSGTLAYKVPTGFPTHGPGAVSRVQVRVAWEESRPAAGEALYVAAPPKRTAHATDKKIFAHYMGCWPAGTGPLLWQRQTEAVTLHHEAAKGTAAYFGGHVRNFDLVDPVKQLTAEQSADLEIRRAMRIGIDGFSIDAWAGDKSARDTVDVLFKVAEEKNYPFEITLCIDPICGGSIVDSVKELLEKHGKSPKLARRNGKPLIFGYMSVFTGYGSLAKYAPDRVEQLRTEPIGWHLMGTAFDDAARQVGQPIYYQYCMSSFFYNIDQKLIQKDSLTRAAGVLGRYADAVGGFTWLGPEQPEMAKAVRAAGAEWSMPVGMFQKENIPYECYVPKGTDYLHWGKAALDQDATLIQLITWNDYGENTNIAPAWNTRYTLYDLTGYEIKIWKTGNPPPPDHDRVYLIYRKYPKGAKIFPFHACFPDVEPGVIEVLTILPKGAKIRLPGRDAEYEAPAGLFRKQFPVTAGPMIAELLRDGKVEIRLESPEPITDKPFREDNGFVCWSTEEERLWKEDFGETPPFWYSEYGDVDHDGLPNWFEMYWFSKERNFKPKVREDDLGGKPDFHYSRWLDFSTAGSADPKASHSGDGKTNLQHYLTQTDPTREVSPAGPGVNTLPAKE